MDETTTLSADQIEVKAVVDTNAADYTCCNNDPHDSCYSYADSDPTNGVW